MNSRVCIAIVVVLLAGTSDRAATPKFFPDDPIQVDNDTALDVSKVMTIEDSNYYDFVANTFLTPGEMNDMPAVNVNTMDEVPDSTWFTNRIGRTPIPADAFVRGPDRVDSLSVDGWPIVQGKSLGRQGGFRMADPSGHLYQIEFDPPSNPEMATAAEMIGTVFYHALGYNVVDVYLVEVDPEKLTIAPTATTRDPRTGKRRRFTRTDLDDILRDAARLPNGKYRALASRFADGRQVGSFRYQGTRPDDPNDIFPHEHRRELRGNRVFAAWLNHDDSRGLNSLDMLVSSEGRHYIKHYMFDFGSIMGSGTYRAQTPRAGNEYILDWKAGFLTMGTLGLYVRPWLTIDYPDAPDSVGNFEADDFDPEIWKPEYPNPAFRNMQPEDAFWGARLVAKFTNEMIRAAVEKGRYSDPGGTEYVTQTLIKRRDKVVQVWLNRVNPVVDPQLSAAGVLTFRNAAVDAGAATPAASYTVSWSRFDNAAGTHTWVADTTVTETTAQAPAEVLQGTDYVAVLIRGVHPQQARWLRPTRVYFRREGTGWKTVGIERSVYREKEQLGLAPMSPTRRY